MRYRSKNLEIHVVDHCNLDCVGCSHGSPLMASRSEDLDRLGSALQALWRHYEAPLVKLLGGEPLLHPRVSELISLVADVTGARLRLVTNGSLLARRYDRVVGVDEIHISAYPGVVIPSQDQLATIAASVGADVTVQRFDAFRWPRSPERHDEALTRRIFRTCQLYQTWQCHTLRDGWFHPCPPPATWGESGDGFDLLAPDVDVAASLGRVLDRVEPLATCSTCLGSSGRLLDHRRGWRRERDPFGESGVDHRFLVRLEVEPDAWNDCYDYDYTIRASGEVLVHRDR